MPCESIYYTQCKPFRTKKDICCCVPHTTNQKNRIKMCRHLHCRKTRVFRKSESIRLGEWLRVAVNMVVMITITIHSHFCHFLLPHSETLPCKPECPFRATKVGAKRSCAQVELASPATNGSAKRSRVYMGLPEWAPPATNGSAKRSEMSSPVPVPAIWREPSGKQTSGSFHTKVPRLRHRPLWNRCEQRHRFRPTGT